MSLEELKAQAEAEETEVEQPEAEEPEQEEADEPETEQEETEEPEAEEAEESEDFELELEGDSTPDQQNKPDAVEVLQHKLSRKNRQKKRAEEERDSLKEELEQIKSMLRGGQQPQQPAPQARSAAEPVFPDLYDDGINGDRQKYDAAVKQYFADMQSFQARHQEAERAQNDYRNQIQEMTNALTQSAKEFCQTERVSPERMGDALSKAVDDIDEFLGIEGAGTRMLKAAGKNGAKVGYHLGTSERAMNELKSLLKADPSGIDAAYKIGEWASNLKRKQSKRISKAPEPDQSLKGDGSTTSVKQLQQMYDKASEKSDMAKMREIKRQAEKVGVALK